MVEGEGGGGARVDAVLVEDRLQVAGDGARADEQLRANLGIGAAHPSQPGDLPLLGCQRFSRILDAPVNHLTSRPQFTAGSSGKTVRAHVGEQVVGEPQLDSSIGSAVGPPKPFAVQQVGAGQVYDHRASSQVRQSGLIVHVGIGACTDQSS